MVNPSITPSCLSMVIFNCKINFSRFFIFVLLLSGDIYLNPEPSAAIPCWICQKEVLDSNPAVQCDQCNAYVHVNCDSSLTVSIYNDMLANCSNEPWFCSVCSLIIHKPSTTSYKGLSCVCFNSRGIAFKRLDVVAFVCAHQFDAVAITETFLDRTIPDALVVPDGYFVFWQDRNRHGGGILALTKSLLISIHHCNLEPNWLEPLTSKDKINFVTFYCPPSSMICSTL